MLIGKVLDKGSDPVYCYLKFKERHEQTPDANQVE